MPKVHPLCRRNNIESWGVSKPSQTDGQIVFACWKELWYPGVVITHELKKMEAKQNFEWVYWYGETTMSQISHENICSFRQYFLQMTGDVKVMSKKLNKGFVEAINNCLLQDTGEEASNDEKSEWESKGIQALTEIFHSLPHPSSSEEDKIRELPLSEYIIEGINSVKEILQYETMEATVIKKSKRSNKSVMKMKTEEAKRSRQESEENKESAKERSEIFRLNKYLEESGKDIDDVCISCRNINLRITKHHPLFKGGICDACQENLIMHLFAMDSDGTMVVCTICAGSGELFLCDKVGCKRAYCTTCFNEMGLEKSVEKIKKIKQWICMLCRSKKFLTDGCLVARKDWWDNVTKLFFNPTHDQMKVYAIKKKNGMRVLSLFDGISTGYYALTQLGIKVQWYAAFEIDQNAIKVSEKNFGKNVMHLGNVESLSCEVLAAVCPLDLIIGGSPCNDLSAANPARKGLYGVNSTGHLFFEFYRILKTVQSLTDGPLYWFYENVASMQCISQLVMNRFFNSKPYVIDAKHFSPQRRSRLFWGNIPGMAFVNKALPNDCPNLSSVLSPNCQREAIVEKINTITTQENSLKSGKQHPLLMEGKSSKIWVTELEKVFGLPCHFTDTGDLTPSQRQQLLGKSWSVQVIMSILNPLRHFFTTENH